MYFGIPGSRWRPQEVFERKQMQQYFVAHVQERGTPGRPLCARKAGTQESLERRTWRRPSPLLVTGTGTNPLQ